MEKDAAAAQRNARIPDVSVIIVNWNLKEFLKPCLESVEHGGRGLEVETIVVDNASTDGSPEMIEAEFPHVTLIRNDRNVGFSRANNQAMLLARGRYLFLLNNDALLYEQTLPRLVEFMDGHAEAGVCGPRVLNEDGTLQVHSKGRYPSVATALGQFFVPERWRQRGDRPLGFYEHQDTMLTREVDWVSGCALLARRDAADAVGMLDADVFMYCEDVDWCRRMRAAGWKVYYHPAAAVLHYGGKSMKLQTGLAVGAHRAGLVAFYSKYHGPPAAMLFRGVLLLGYGVRAVGWLLQALAGKRAGMDKLRRMLFGLARNRNT